jgi:phage terminase large subunit GpA-like protein
MIVSREEPLPPFAAASKVLRFAVQSLRPPPKVSVSEAAERHRRLSNPGGGYSGPWQNALAPYLVEPMDRAMSRDVKLLILVGPTQFGKTEIFLNIIAHAAKYRPGDILLFQPTKDLAIDFAERRLQNKCLDVSPDLQAELGPSRSDDKVLTKTFRNGLMVTIAWPVGSQLASRPLPTVLMDERDSMPDDIQGEGDPVALAEKRITNFGRNGVVVVASTPKRQDESGIMSLYKTGDRRIMHVRCPHCLGFFSPGFDADRKPTLKHLHIEPNATAEEAAAAACMICDAGCVILEAEKPALVASGVWLALGQAIDADGNIQGQPPKTRVASYWFTGLLVRDKRWPDMAFEFVTARKALDERQDEQPLKTFWNTTMGAPYKPRHVSEGALDGAVLKARAEDYPLDTVPAWASFLLASVDVQGNRFVVSVIAFGPGGECAVISYFDIFKSADGERMVDPAKVAEDWDLLIDHVINRSFPVQGGGSMVPFRTGIDTGGKDGVTGQAYDFWLRVRRLNRLDKRIVLLKGGRKTDAPLTSNSLIEADRRGRKLKKGIKLTTANVAAIKSMADIRLRMKAPGPGYIHLSKHLPDRYFEEVTAEVHGPNGWDKLRPRNEAWDLLIYCLAVFIRIGGLRMPTVAAAAATPPPGQTQAAKTVAKPVPKTVAKPQQRRGWIGKRQNWV